MYIATVRPDGAEPFTVEVDERDVLAWEEGGTGRKYGQLADLSTLKMTDIYGVTFEAVMRTETFSGDIRAFKKQCRVSIEPSPDSGAGPTLPAP